VNFLGGGIDGDFDDDKGKGTGLKWMLLENK
jgi:hypothetical protein